jgi:hypothetical protein
MRIPWKMKLLNLATLFFHMVLIFPMKNELIPLEK